MHAQYRSGIAFTIILALVVGGLVSMFFIVFKRMRADTAYAITAQNAVALYEHNERAWGLAKQTFANDTASVQAFSSLLITTDTVPDFLSTLEEKASAQGVQFSISTVSTNPIAGTPTLSITFSGIGNKNRLESFLHSLETLPQQIKETAFSFSETTDPDAVKAALPLWRVNATIQVLSFTP